MASNKVFRYEENKTDNVEMNNANKGEFSTPSKTGYVDILQKLYGDSWRTPSVLKNDLIKEELSAKRIDKAKSQSNSNALLDFGGDEVQENSQIDNSSSDSINSALKFNVENYNIIVSDSDSESSKDNFENEKKYNITVSDSASQCSKDNFENANKLSNSKELLKMSNSSNSSSDNFKLSDRKFIKKKKLFDSFIDDSSESSSSNDDVNTPAYYNRLEALIQSETKSKYNHSPSIKWKNNIHKKLLYFDSSSDDDDERLTNATICDIDDDDDEEDNLNECFKDLKLSDKYSKPTYKTARDRDQKLTFLESLSENVDLSLCHRDAVPYLKNFQKTRDKLARALFNLYNEKVFNNKLTNDMELIWCKNLRTTGGLCQSRRLYKNNEVTYICSIKLSTKVVDRPCRLRDTLIHELCHAANFEIDKIRDAKHSLKWKYWTKKAEKCFPELPHITTSHNYIIEYNFAYKCTRCSNKFYRHTNSFKDTDCFCGGIIICQKRQSDGTYKDYIDKKAPSAFAKFVKENYNKVNTPDRNHKERMKELSNLYAQKKLSF